LYFKDRKFGRELGFEGSGFVVCFCGLAGFVNEKRGVKPHTDYIVKE